MGVQNYEGVRELAMKESDKQEFEAGFQKIRDAIVSYGFAQKAADSLKFKVSEHTLEISESERKSGAWHIYGDGKPFFALTLTAPGSIESSVGAGSAAPTTLPEEQQSRLLALEIGINLLPNINKVLQQIYSQNGNAAGGVSGSLAEYNFETTLRCEPKIYMEALNDIVHMRLMMIAPPPELASKRPAPSAPVAPNAPSQP
jgi:hypothetical protein